MDHPINAIGILKKQKKWNYGVTANGTPECGYCYGGKSDPTQKHYLYHDQVKFECITRGQSSTRANLVSRNGGKYELSPIEIGFYLQILTGLTDIPFSIDSEGYVDVYFVLVKQGSNIGIEFVNPETIQHEVL